MYLEDYLISYIVKSPSLKIESDDIAEYRCMQLKDVWSIQILGSRRTKFVLIGNRKKSVDVVKSYTYEISLTFPSSTSMDIVLDKLVKALYSIDL